jgi:hypothetical protein
MTSSWADRIDVPLADWLVEVIADAGASASPRNRYGSGGIVAGRTVPIRGLDPSCLASGPSRVGPTDALGSLGNRATAGCVEQRMNATNPAHRHRDLMTALFAAALDGEHHAEHELRILAAHNGRAADALCALAYAGGSETVGPRCPADVAATDQVIAAVLESIGAAVQRAEPASP